MTTLYGINNCDTIKKTRVLLTELGVDFDFHDYKKAGCSRQLLKIFLQNFSHEELINSRGTTWRKLPNNEKENLSVNSALRLMSEHNSLIKRPIIERNGEWLLGFDKEKIQHLVLG